MPPTTTTSTTTTTIPAPGGECELPAPLPPTAGGDLVELHERATAAIESLNGLIAAFGQPGWEWPGPLALDLLRTQIDVFALSGLLDQWFDGAGGTLDGAGLWALPPDAPLAPVLGARNAVIHFEAVVLPAVLSAPTLDAARNRFFELDGCAIAAELVTGLAVLAGGES